MYHIKKHLIFVRCFFIYSGGLIKGLVYKVESKDYYLLLDDGSEVRCSLRGRLKKEHHLKKNKLKTLDIAVIGDYVEFTFNEDGTGVIEELEERKNILARKAPKLKGAGTRGERLQQIIAANIDTIFIVMSIREPMFNNRVLDRILVTAESDGLDVIIIINKSDLDEDEELEIWQELYEEIGYTVIPTNALSGEGIGSIKEKIKDKKSVFWGQSGVGKSSLLNAVNPELNFKTGEVSESNQKGRHTTVTAIVKKLEKDTFVIDTPGVREIEPFGLKKEDLGHYFREFKEFLEHCKFNTCTHTHEPGCAVRAAVGEEIIALERYESYINILESVEEDIIF